MLFFAGSATHAGQKVLRSALVERYPETREQGAEVLLILPCSADACLDGSLVDLPFRPCWTRTWRSIKRWGQSMSLNAPVPPVYVTDRYLEAYGVWRQAEGTLCLRSGVDLYVLFWDTKSVVFKADNCSFSSSQ